METSCAWLHLIPESDFLAMDQKEELLETALPERLGNETTNRNNPGSKLLNRRDRREGREIWVDT